MKRRGDTYKNRKGDKDRWREREEQREGKWKKVKEKKGKEKERQDKQVVPKTNICAEDIKFSYPEKPVRCKAEDP